MPTKLEENVSALDAALERTEKIRNTALEANRPLNETEESEYKNLKAEIALRQDAVVEERIRMEKDKTLLDLVDKDNKPKTDTKLWDSMGEFAVNVVRGSQHPQMADRRLSFDVVGVGTGMNESTPSEGGFLVPPQYSDQLLRRTFETGEILRRLREFNIGPNRLELRIPGVQDADRSTGNRQGGLQSYWLEEAELKVASRPKFREVRLMLHKNAAVVFLTDELMQDAVGLEGFLNQMVPDEIRFALEYAVINGDGIGKPLGYRNSTAYITVAEEDMQVAGTVDVFNLIKMYSRFWSRSKTSPGAVWMVSGDVHPQLLNLTIGETPVYLAGGNITGRPYSTLFGIPVIETEYAPALGAAGDIELVDFREIGMIQRRTIQRDVSMHVRFLYDETALRWVTRFDSKPLWDVAITPANGSSFTQSPYVGLGART